MLKGISPVVSPDLLKVLSEMGHGDEIVFADAHFPGHSVNDRVLRADGVSVSELLKGRTFNASIAIPSTIERGEPTLS